jgi:hypothetical protein
MCNKVSSDWLPSYIKATRPVLEIFKMAGHFPDSPHIYWPLSGYPLHGSHRVLLQKRNNSGLQVVVANKFCAVVPNICGSSEWNLPHVTILTPRIWRWVLVFFNLISGRLSSSAFAIMTAHSLAQWSAWPPPSFKPYLPLVFGFALSHLARILVLIILYESCLLPAEFCDKIIHVFFGYKNQSVNAAQWNNRCLFWDPHETHKCDVWTERRIFSVLKTWWYIKKPLDFRGLIFVSDFVKKHKRHFLRQPCN